MLDYVTARINLPRRQRGLTTVEYAIAGGLIVVVVVAAMALIGTKASSSLNAVGNAMR